MLFHHRLLNCFAFPSSPTKLFYYNMFFYCKIVQNYKWSMNSRLNGQRKRAFDLEIKHLNSSLWWGLLYFHTINIFMRSGSSIRGQFWGHFFFVISFVFFLSAWRTMKNIRVLAKYALISFQLQWNLSIVFNCLW